MPATVGTEPAWRLSGISSISLVSDITNLSLQSPTHLPGSAMPTYVHPDEAQSSSSSEVGIGMTRFSTLAGRLRGSHPLNGGYNRRSNPQYNAVRSRVFINNLRLATVFIRHDRPYRTSLLASWVTPRCCAALDCSLSPGTFVAV